MAQLKVTQFIITTILIWRFQVEIDILHGIGQLCPICLSNSKDMAFGCGHQVDFLLYLRYYQLFKEVINILISLYGRRVANVEETSSHAQYVGAQFRPE